MSSESIMSSLGLNYANSTHDLSGESKTASKQRPSNNYVIEASNEDLIELQASSSVQTDHRYAIYQSELTILRRDMERLKSKTDDLLEKENKVYRHKAYHEEITIRKDNNQTLSQSDQNILNGLTKAKIEDWLNQAIKARSDSQDKKIKLMDKIDDLEVKCKKILKDGNNDLVIERGGKHFLRFTAAEVDDYQPMRRGKDAVALIFVRLLTRCDKLIKIRMDPVLDLLKEYRDCYTSNDRRYKKFNVVISRIETNKDSVSRYDLTQMMFDLLNPQRQLDYISAITICMKNPEYKKAMEMPAADKPRELMESIQKRKSDHKKPSAQNNSRFRKTSTRGQYRQRGGFRQSNFRFNRNFQRGNNFRSNNRFSRPFNQMNQRPYRQNKPFYNNDNRETQNYNNNYNSGNNNAQNLNQPPPAQKQQNNRGNFRGSNNR
jgi:hypothetical protein